MNSVTKIFTTAIVSGLMMGVAHADNHGEKKAEEAAKTKTADEAAKCCGQMKGKDFDDCKAKMGKGKGMGHAGCSPGACATPAAKPADKKEVKKEEKK